MFPCFCIFVIAALSGFKSVAVLERPVICSTARPNPSMVSDSLFITLLLLIALPFYFVAPSRFHFPFCIWVRIPNESQQHWPRMSTSVLNEYAGTLCFEYWTCCPTRVEERNNITKNKESYEFMRKMHSIVEWSRFNSLLNHFSKFPQLLLR